MYYRNTTDCDFFLINCISVKDTDLNSIYGVMIFPDKGMKVDALPIIEEAVVNRLEASKTLISRYLNLMIMK